MSGSSDLLTKRTLSGPSNGSDEEPYPFPRRFIDVERLRKLHMDMQVSDCTQASFVWLTNTFRG